MCRFDSCALESPVLGDCKLKNVYDIKYKRWYNRSAKFLFQIKLGIEILRPVLFSRKNGPVRTKQRKAPNVENVSFIEATKTKRRLVAGGYFVNKNSNHYVLFNDSIRRSLRCAWSVGCNSSINCMLSADGGE